jgi:ABC-2 type transport system permease protein
MTAGTDLTWTPFLTLFRREIARFMKVVAQTVVTPIVTGALYLMIFGVSLGKQIAIEGGISYLAFLIPGLVMMGCLNNAFQNSSSSIISSKFSGDLEDLKAAPFNSMQIIAALSLAALVRGLMVGAITFGVGTFSYFFVYGEFLGVSHPFILLLFLTLGAVTFSNIGISVAFWAKSFDQMSAVGGFVLLPLIYLGGVFFSVDHLPGFWKTLSLGNPLLYMINGVRYGILGAADVSPTRAFFISAAAVIVTGLFAVRSVHRGSFLRW